MVRRQPSAVQRASAPDRSSRPSASTATCGAGLGQLGGQIAEAVALLAADEPDAANACRSRWRWRRRRPASARGRRCRPCRRRCRRADRSGSRDTVTPSALHSTCAAHRREQVGEPRVALQRSARQAVHRDRAAGDGGHGQRVARRRGVGLDAVRRRPRSGPRRRRSSRRRRARRRRRTPPSPRRSSRRTAATRAGSSGRCEGRRAGTDRSASAPSGTGSRRRR